MNMMRTSLLACFAFLVVAAAFAAETATLPDSTENDRTSVAVTVYNVDLALVRETRKLSIPRAGASALRFMDVPSSINPRTVHLKSLTSPGGKSGGC